MSALSVSLPFDANFTRPSSCVIHLYEQFLIGPMFLACKYVFAKAVPGIVSASKHIELLCSGLGINSYAMIFINKLTNSTNKK
jgi:hypothetical protein